MTALGVAGAREMGSIVRFGQISARSSKDRKWPITEIRDRPLFQL
jgi:hypothetical protein